MRVNPSAWHVISIPTTVALYGLFSLTPPAWVLTGDAGLYQHLELSGR